VVDLVLEAAGQQVVRLDLPRRPLLVLIGHADARRPGDVDDGSL
jgi:hypothetical protein